MMSNKQPEIYFHVGLPKTASTFLQRNVFPRLEGIEYVKKHSFHKYNRYVENTSHSKILFSTELNIGKKRTNEKIRKFAQSYPDARPIILLRRHDRWIRSKYKQHIRKHGWLSFDEFFNIQDTGKVKVYELYYKDKVDFLNGLFNHPAVVLFQEELLDDPWKAIDRICRITGTTYAKESIDTNRVKPSYSTKQLKAMRRFNQHIQFEDPPEDQPKIIRKSHKKFHAFLLHSVAYLSYLWPGKWIKPHGHLIPPERPDQIRQHFRGDWQRSIEYAQNQRQEPVDINL